MKTAEIAVKMTRNVPFIRHTSAAVREIKKILKDNNMDHNNDVVIKDILELAVSLLLGIE